MGFKISRWESLLYSVSLKVQHGSSIRGPLSKDPGVPFGNFRAFFVLSAFFFLLAVKVGGIRSVEGRFAG